ncbi:MAG TPA: MarR family transcriptional regulator [Kofleriaceae bacterium]|nr:MarR family transcriptional regulator [Kofleriaceae bacterium]
MRDLSDADYRALADFRHQLRRFIAFSETAARGQALEPRQHQVLLALRGLPRDVEPTVQVLANQLVLKHHTVVELLDRLEALQLVRRERALDDRRRVLVALTTKGSELLRKLSSAHLDELRSLAPALVGSLNGVLRASRGRA